MFYLCFVIILDWLESLPDDGWEFVAAVAWVAEAERDWTRQVVIAKVAAFAEVL